MSSNKYPKFFEEFLALQQPPKPHLPATTADFTNPRRRATVANEPLTFETIIEKKPKPKRVLKYLQKMIDEIVAEND
jgi:hypothetical protein